MAHFSLQNRFNAVFDHKLFKVLPISIGSILFKTPLRNLCLFFFTAQIQRIAALLHSSSALRFKVTNQYLDHSPARFTGDKTEFMVPSIKTIKVLEQQNSPGLSH